MMPNRKTDINDFFEELNAGAFKEKLSYALSDIALAVVVNGNGKKKGKLTIEFSVDQLGDNDQVLISHKLRQEAPTKRGKKSEEDTTETAFFVGPGGCMSIAPPKEEISGQFTLKHESDGIRPIR